MLTPARVFSIPFVACYTTVSQTIQDDPGGKVNILGGHIIGHSKQKSVYVHVCYSERFPR
jgi:hypothetical protein